MKSRYLGFIFFSASVAFGVSELGDELLEEFKGATTPKKETLRLKEHDDPWKCEGVSLVPDEESVRVGADIFFDLAVGGREVRARIAGKETKSLDGTHGLALSKSPGIGYTGSTDPFITAIATKDRYLQVGQRDVTGRGSVSFRLDQRTGRESPINFSLKAPSGTFAQAHLEKRVFCLRELKSDSGDPELIVEVSVSPSIVNDDTTADIEKRYKTDREKIALGTAHIQHWNKNMESKGSKSICDSKNLVQWVFVCE